MQGKGDRDIEEMDSMLVMMSASPDGEFVWYCQMWSRSWITPPRTPLSYGHSNTYESGGLTDYISDDPLILCCWSRFGQGCCFSVY